MALTTLYRRFWTDILDSSLYNHHQNTKWKKYILEECLQQSSTVLENIWQGGGPGPCPDILLTNGTKRWQIASSEKEKKVNKSNNEPYLLIICYVFQFELTVPKAFAA